MSLFDSLKNGLKKTKDSLFRQIHNLFMNFTKVDEELLDELEEILISSDVGINTTEEIIDKLRYKIKDEKLTDPEEAFEGLKEILREMIGDGSSIKIETKPSVILVIGVNGVGKTTSVAKIANLLKSQGKSVLISAADTFRAAAIDQLQIWADRIDVDIIKQKEGSDPAAVVFDSINAAKSRKKDIIIIDTAGRLHNKVNLMNELGKINRVIDRELPGCDKNVLLVLDATTGQNAIRQAVEFKNVADITGLILTKLDGTAKGGIIFSVKKELEVNVEFIGVGEKQEDFQVFDPDSFIEALFK